MKYCKKLVKHNFFVHNKVLIPIDYVIYGVKSLTKKMRVFIFYF